MGQNHIGKLTSYQYGHEEDNSWVKTNSPFYSSFEAHHKQYTTELDPYRPCQFFFKH